MTPSLRIDRIVAGVGRIVLSSGTPHKPTFKRINAMLSALAALGELGLLKDIKEGVHKPLVVLHHYERGTLNRLTRESGAPLLDTLTTWSETHEASASYRSDLKTSVRHIGRAKGAKTATVSALPALLRQMKDGFRDRPVAFNRLRTHMLAFASEIAGEMSPLWTEVKRVKRFKKAEGTQLRKLKRRPLTVAELDLVCAAFEDHVVHGGRKGAGNKGKLVERRTIRAGALASMTRTLATTGMRPAEYWQRNGATWEEGFAHAWVEGTKTRAAARPTFMLIPLCRPQCGEQFFRKAFAAATEKAIRVGLDAYSLRRTFAKLLEDANVPPSRARAYMGHGPKTVSDLYLQTEVLPFVEQDAALVTAWIASERAKASAPRMEVMR